MALEEKRHTEDAVVFGAPGRLKKVPVQGGEATVLCHVSFTQGGSWGEDGNIIAALLETGVLARIPSMGGVPTPISELAPGTPPLRMFFPRRNRIISGLSRAVVVIEAGEKSGSLITARCALEQGRDVLAVPGNVLSGRNRGAHALLPEPG